ATGPLYGDLLGLSLSVALIRKYGHPSPTPTLHKGGIAKPRLNRVLEYIAANLPSEIHLEDIAAVAGLSVFHFARAFRESTGVTPHQYVLQRRIDTVKTLLRTRNWNLETIASATGFADARHLTQAFRAGVLAVIITIMVLDLRVPHENGLPGLLTIAPILCIYLLSFAFIGI